MRNFTLKYLYLIPILVLFFASCSTKRGITPAQPAAPKLTTLYAPQVRFTINYAERTVAANGAIAMLADTAIYISVQPLLGIELFRVEINQEDLRIIDKMNRRYVLMTYPELAQYTGSPVTYNDIQNFCTGKPTPLTAHKELTIQYLDWTKINDIDIPQTFKLDLQLRAQTGSATIALQRLMINEPLPSSVQPCKLNNYQPTTINALLYK